MKTPLTRKQIIDLIKKEKEITELAISKMKPSYDGGPKIGLAHIDLYDHLLQRIAKFEEVQSENLTLLQKLKFLFGNKKFLFLERR